MAAAAPPVLFGSGLSAFESTPGSGLAPALPAGTVRNDVLLLVFVHAANGPLAAPSGWTQLGAQNNGAGLRCEVWWKRAGSSETSPTLALATPAVSTIRGARILGIRGCPPDRSPFRSIQLQSNASSTVVGLPAGGSSGAQELALALVAYGEDPFAATTMPGWTQPADAVQGYSVDPWSGSAVVASADPDVPSGGGAGPGAALLHQHRTLAAAGSAGAGTITVSGGTFAAAPSISVLLLAAPTPLGSLQARARFRVVSTRGGPARGRTRALARAVGARTERRPGELLVAARAALVAIKGSLGPAAPGILARGASDARKASSGAAQARLSIRSLVDSMRTPFFFREAVPSVRIHGRSTHVSVLSPGPLPVRPPVPIDLGEIYRGDTVRLPTWVALSRNGLPVDLSGVSLRFTAKLALTNADEAPTTINASTEDGTITVSDTPRDGRYRVTIPSTETQELEIDGAFTFDVQLSLAGAPQAVHTVQTGRLLVMRDVTRATA